MPNCPLFEILVNMCTGINQVVMSKILKLNLSFLSSRFFTWPKSQNKHFNILRTKRAFKASSCQTLTQTLECTFKPEYNLINVTSISLIIYLKLNYCRGISPMNKTKNSNAALINYWKLNYCRGISPMNKTKNFNAAT